MNEMSSLIQRQLSTQFTAKTNKNDLGLIKQQNYNYIRS